MTIALLCIGDGRDEYHAMSLRSADEMLGCDFDQVVTIDDREHRLGFAGAIQAGWNQIRTDFVFHLELDFTFNKPIPVYAMIALLQREAVAQVALKRQPWNEAERRAGGVVEANPDAFTDRETDGDPWLEHRAFFTTNPSVYSSRLCEGGWPQGARSEGVFTHRLLSNPRTRCAYWGRRFDMPHVTHIGDARAGVGY